MKLHRIILSRPLPHGDEAGAAHRLMVKGCTSDVRALFRVENYRTITLLAGDGAWNPRQLGGLLSHAEEKPYQPQPSNGERYRYRIRVSPYTRQSHRFGREVDTQEDIEAWWSPRLMDAGAEVVTPPTVFWEGHKRARNGQVVLPAATLEGILEVTDAQVFAEALATGIGRHKTYGFGLMQVARDV